MTEVVAALIMDETGRALICRRPAHKARGLLFEFPGGKVDLGEGHKEALARECREELDILLEVGELYMKVVHAYPDLTVALYLYRARIREGTPRLLEHAAFAWVRPKDFPNYDFCPADTEIIARLAREDAG